MDPDATLPPEAPPTLPAPPPESCRSEDDDRWALTHDIPPPRSLPSGFRLDHPDLDE